MRSDYIQKEIFTHLLAALMRPNRLALEVSLVTGLRINDVLSLPSERLAQRMTIREQKTGKNKRIYIPIKLLEQLYMIKGKYWVFEGRLDPKKHRTRQAVWKDLKRAAKLFRIPDKSLQISPHSARKIYAVTQYQTSGSLAKVQKLLQHEDEAVTMLYAMADVLTARNHPTFGERVAAISGRTQGRD